MAAIRHRLALVGGSFLLLVLYLVYRSQQHPAGVATGGESRRDGDKAGPVGKEEEKVKVEDNDKKQLEEHEMHPDEVDKVVAVPEEEGGMFGNKQEERQPEVLQEHIKPQVPQQYFKQQVDARKMAGLIQKLSQEPQKVSDKDYAEGLRVFKSLKFRAERGQRLSAEERQLYVQLYQLYGSWALPPQENKVTTPPTQSLDEGQRAFLADRHIYGQERKHLGPVIKKQQGLAGSNQGRMNERQRAIPGVQQDKQRMQQQVYLDKQHMERAIPGNQQGYMNKQRAIPGVQQGNMDKQRAIHGVQQGNMDKQRAVPGVQQGSMDRQQMKQQGHLDEQRAVPGNQQGNMDKQRAIPGVQQGSMDRQQTKQQGHLDEQRAVPGNQQGYMDKQRAIPGVQQGYVDRQQMKQQGHLDEQHVERAVPGSQLDKQQMDILERAIPGFQQGYTDKRRNLERAAPGGENFYPDQEHLKEGQVAGPGIRNGYVDKQRLQKREEYL